MDSRKIIVLEDSTTNALMLINHCIIKYGIDSVEWINLGREKVSLDSIQEQEIYTRIKKKYGRDFLSENNYLSTVDPQDVLDKLNKINKGKFVIFYDLQLGEIAHIEISKKLGELVSKSKKQEDLCVFILIYSSSQSRTDHMQLIDINDIHVSPSSLDFGSSDSYDGVNKIAEKIVNEGNEGFENICETGIEKKIWPIIH